MVADFIHWRGVFVVLGVISLIALVLAVSGLRGLPEAPRQPLDPRTVRRCATAPSSASRRRASATSPCCCEGIFLMGLFAYVAVLLLEAGEPRASIAGSVIASFAVGGIVYSIGIGSIAAAARPEKGDDRRRTVHGVRHRRARIRAAVAGAVRGVRRHGARLLHAARQHPGVRHRACAGDAQLRRSRSTRSRFSSASRSAPRRSATGCSTSARRRRWRSARSRLR